MDATAALGAGALRGRRGLVVGVANHRSLAFAIGQSAVAAGATLALTYQPPRGRAPVTALAQQLGVAETDVLPWDATDDGAPTSGGTATEAAGDASAARAACHPADVAGGGQVTPGSAGDLARLVAHLTRRWGALDFLVHAVAAAPREALTGSFLSTSRAAFAQALDVSAYSLVALCRALRPLLVRGQTPAVLTLTYQGSRVAMPNYNVMGVAKAALEASMRYLACELGPEGIRVNALSAGPVRTLSAAAVGGLREQLAHVAERAPLRRNVEGAEVGDAALWALGPLGRGVTGEILHVDAGMHCTAVAPRPIAAGAPNVAAAPAAARAAS